jgi:hypothetical protein
MAAAEDRRRADMGHNGPSDHSSTLACISAWSSAGAHRFHEVEALAKELAGFTQEEAALLA